MREPRSSARSHVPASLRTTPLVTLLLAALAPVPRVSSAALVYSTYLGGSEIDEGQSIAVDASGAVYIAGPTYSIDFPVVGPAQPMGGGGTSDAFVTKLSPSGTSIVYSTYLGGSGHDAAFAIAVDSTGRAYVTGSTRSFDFPLVAPVQSANHGSDDAFVAMLDVDGSVLVYSTYFGGNAGDAGLAIDVDASGAAYVTGVTDSADFPLESPLQSSRAGSYDAFVTKLGAVGASVVYSTFLGGDDWDSAGGIAVDAFGAAYVMGNTNSSNFPTVSAFQSAKAGSADLFVSKLDPVGSALVYSTYLGGTSYEDPGSIRIAPGGRAVISGLTWSQDLPTLNALQPGNAGLTDAFVTELGPGGSSILFSTYFGGSDRDGAHGLAIGASGAITFAGDTMSLDSPTRDPFQAMKSPGIEADSFVTRIASDGSSLIYSTYLGGHTFDTVLSVAVDAAGAAYVAGITNSTNFPLRSPLQPALAGFGDAIVAKIDGVSAPTGPTCEAGPDIAAGCDGVTLGATASDAGSNPLTFLWTSSCPGTTFTPSATVLDPVVDLASTCNATCTLTLSVNGVGGSCSDSLVLAVSDVTPPALAGIPVDVTVACNAVPPPSTGVTASDGCVPGPLAVTSSEVVTPGSCPDSYTIARTYSATDPCGNVVTSVQSITVRDTAPPTLSGVPPSVTVECDALPAPSTAVTASDGCAPGPIAVTSSDVVTSGSCPDRYTITRTYSAADRCGNVTTAAQTITVRDTTPPVLANVPPSATVECDAVPPSSATVTASDNCASAPVAVTSSDVVTPGSCPDRYTITRTYSAADRCGNVATAAQTITVRDTTAPALLGVPPDVTVECDDLPPPAPITALDNCDPAPALTFTEARIDGSCPSDYTLVRTWTAIDRCGNAATATQQVTVRDTTPPVVQSNQDQLACLWPANHRYVCFARTDFPLVAADNCSASVTWRLAGCVSDQCDDAPCREHPGENGDGSTHDDCIVSPDGEQVCVRAERAGTEPGGRHYTLTVTAEDDCGNVSPPAVIGTVLVPHDGGGGGGCIRR